MNAATKQVAIVDPASRHARTFDYSGEADAELVVRASKVTLHDAIASAEQSSRGVAGRGPHCTERRWLHGCP